MSALLFDSRMTDDEPTAFNPVRLMIRHDIFKLISGCLLSALLLVNSQISSAEVERYTIDTKGAHASINFRVKHLGYSWLLGRFDSFEGSFLLDRKDPSQSSVSVNIDPASVNSGHAERDKHLRGDDFLDVKKYPVARFVSKRIELAGENAGKIIGDFTLRGVTNEIVIDAELIGGGKDPWGGFRVGFMGTTKISLADYGINYNLGPKSKEVELTLHVEGIRQ